MMTPLILYGLRPLVSLLTCVHTVISAGKSSEGIQCDLCYSWVHTTCEGISKAHSMSLKEVLSAKRYLSV